MYTNSEYGVNPKIIIYVDSNHRTSDIINIALCILEERERERESAPRGGGAAKKAEWQYSDAISAYLTSNLFINVSHSCKFMWNVKLSYLIRIYSIISSWWWSWQRNNRHKHLNVMYIRTQHTYIHAHAHILNELKNIFAHSFSPLLKQHIFIFRKPK